MDTGCWADTQSVAGDGHRLDCLQALDRQVTGQRKFNFCIHKFSYYQSVKFMYIASYIYTCRHF